MVESLKSMFETYGFRATAIVAATVVIVNLIKKPILKKALVLAAEKGYGKTLVTKYFSYVPIAVAFVIDFVVEIIAAGFNFYAIDYAAVASASVLYGALSIALYESVKIHLQAYAEKTKSTGPEENS